ncbi:g11520 [Coccomyxa elongata]
MQKPTSTTSPPPSADISRGLATALSSSGTSRPPGSSYLPAGNRDRRSHLAPHRYNRTRPGASESCISSHWAGPPPDLMAAPKQAPRPLGGCTLHVKTSE